MPNLRSVQSNLAIGPTVDNDKIATKGYVDSHDANAIWTLESGEVFLSTSTNTLKPNNPLKYTTPPSITSPEELATKAYADMVAENIWTRTGITINSTNPGDVVDLTNNVFRYKNYEFNVFLSATKSSVTGNGTAWTIEFDTELYDTDNVFDITTHKFTAPVDGFYRFTSTVRIGNILSNIQRVDMEFVCNDPSRVYILHRCSPYRCRSNLDDLTATGSQDMRVNAGGTVEVRVAAFGGAKTTSGLQNCSFNGSIIKII